MHAPRQISRGRLVRAKGAPQAWLSSILPRGSSIGARSRLSAALRGLLNPLAPPGRRLEGIREILCLVHNFSVAELHNTHCVCWPPLVCDGVFRDPEITVSENSPDVEA